ncbi:MAG: NACHT domain-containing protein [Crocosphaera sp.]|nr:NACHT domain-containing protein [Crocosphaera sp.]
MQKLTQRLVQWIPFGISSLFTLDSLKQGLTEGEWTQTLIPTFVTVCSSLWVKFSSKFIETLETEAEKQGVTTAEALIRTIKNLPLNLAQFFSKASFPKKYSQQLIYTTRDYLTQGLDKDRILKLEKVFVPLKIVTKEAIKVNASIIQPVKKRAKNPREKKIWDFLAAMEEQSAFRRMVILGAPGSGKTTLLRYITLIYAKNTQHEIHPKPPRLIPVLLYLKDITQQIANEKLTLPELITKQIKEQRKIDPLNPPPHWFADKLRQKRCLVMLDGLDEVADKTERQKVRNWVDKQIEAYPDTPFLITSRPYGYRSAPLQTTVTVLEVKPFNLKQMQQFLNSWYLQTEIMSRAGEEDFGVREEARKQAEDLIERILNSKPLADMALNPLLLTMIATVHRRGSALPGKRVELYKEICQVLLEKRQRAKKLDLDYPLTATQKQTVLQVLALRLMQDNTRQFKFSEKAPIIHSKLIEVASSEFTAERFIEQIRDVCSLLVERENDVYEFAHLSFQEYLAAVEIQATQQEKLLLDNIKNSWWHETIRLYAAQSNATNIIRAILNMEEPTVDAMALAYDCRDEGLIIDPDIREQLERRLEKDLESGL